MALKSLVFALLLPVAMASPGLGPRAVANGTTVQLLVGGSGYITQCSFDGTKFDTVYNSTVKANPSWMTPAHGGVYAVDENGNTTSYYAMDSSSGTLAAASGSVGSSGVVHLEVSKDKKRMLGAAYGSQAIDVWDISDAKGGLKLLKTIPITDPPSGNSSHKPAQTLSHPHQTVLDPKGRFFLVNDLGTDSILVIDSDADKFEITSHIKLEPTGRGPRHGAFFTPNSAVELPTFYVVLTELSSEILVFQVDYAPPAGRGLGLVPVIAISSYGKAFPPANATSAAGGEILVVRRTGTVADVYVTNRLTGNATDSIARFELSVDPATGRPALDFKQSVDSLGLGPRSIATDAAGKWLFATNMGGGVGLAAFKRDVATGEIEAKPVASVPATAFAADPAAGFGPEIVLPYHFDGTAA